MKLTEYSISILVSGKISDHQNRIVWPLEQYRIHQDIKDQWAKTDGLAWVVIYNHGKLNHGFSAIEVFRHHGYTEAHIERMIQSVIGKIKKSSKKSI